MDQQHLLVAVAVDPDDDLALADHLADEATRFAAALGARMTLLHVEIPRIPRVPTAFEAPAAVFEAMDAMQQERGKQAQANLAKLEQRARARGVDATARTAPVVGGVAEAIVASAKELGATLVVVGTHGRRGVKRLLLGSVADRVAHTASLPVLLLPPSA